MNKTHSIYGLFDTVNPDEIFYVGQTSNLHSRFKVHSNGKDKSTAHWVKKVNAEGRPIGLKIFETTDALNATEVESRWIQLLSPPLNKTRNSPTFEFKTSPIITLFDMERQYINWVIDCHKGNKLQAAKALGIGRQTLYNKLGMGVEKET